VVQRWSGSCKFSLWEMALKLAAKALALAGACFLGADAVNVDIENGVYNLKQETFDTVVSKFPKGVMVKFYAPWCGHCKKMIPDYEKAARKLKKKAEADGYASGGVRLAKVDATAEEALRDKYEVKTYPTMVIFKDGAVFGNYIGGRDKDDIVNYMSAFLFPTPVDTFARGYFLAHSVYKEALRMIFPGQVRKYLFKAFPVVIAIPFLLLLLCRCCCRSSPAPPPAKKSSKPKKAARSTTPEPNREGKEGEKKDADKAEPKDKEEKKAD